MSSFAASLLIELVRTTLLLAGVGIAAALLLRVARIQSPTLHRLACCLTLLVGWMLVRVPVEVPWYAAEVAQPQSRLPVALPIEMPVEMMPTEDLTAAVPMLPPAFSQPPTELGDALSAATAANEKNPAFSLSTLQSLVAWQTLVVAAWMIGMMAICAWWLLAYLRFVWRLPQPLACEPEWQEEWLNLQAEQGGGRCIALRVTRSLGPLLCRLPQGAELLVPNDLWQALDRDERQAILRHELAHHQRGDVWKSLAMRMLALPHWFNPIAWLAVRRFDEAAEWACDRAAMGEEPTAYARMLLRLGELASTRAPLGSAMSNLPLTNRIRRLLTLETKEDSAMKKALLLSLLLLVIPLASVRVSLVAVEAKPVDPSEKAPTEDSPVSPYESPPAVREAELKMAESAKLAYEGTLAAYLAGNAPIESVITWSNRWLNAELSVAATRDEQCAAARAHLARMQERQMAANALAKLQSRGGEAWAVAAANYYVADAERRLAEIEASAKTSEISAPVQATSAARSATAVPRSIATPAAAGHELRYDGKTFDQWVTELSTELSPAKRKDAMDAMGEFAVNGLGTQAATAIFDTMQGYSVLSYDNSPEGTLKYAAIKSAMRVPAQQLAPVVSKALASGNKNQRVFALSVIPLGE